MRFRDYLYERWIVYLFLTAAFGFAWAVYKLDIGLNLTESNARYILVGWLLLLLAFIAVDYSSYKRRFGKLIAHLEENTLSDERHFPYPTDRMLAERIRALVLDYEEFRSDIRTKSAEQLDFITRWLHDIKVPIAAARLILENSNLDAGVDYRKLDQELTAIEEAAQKVFYELKSESFHEDYKISRVSTHTLIAGALKGYSSLFSYKKLDIEITGGEHQVLSDPKWSTYILAQLISNAVKYTPPGGKIVIAAEADDDRVTVAVKNTGRGIPPQDLGQVFNKGYTSSEERSGGSATGYGLYLAKKLTDLLGHELSCESRYGEYAVFKLTFIATRTLHQVTKM
ncbi:MAG: sensor histidine kinase [Candidatus Wallacebacter cryptica]|jgi:signal transduction histidine kinase|nr:HAMP domain-containing histidine kinase [Bacillota bacterium]